MEHYIEGRVILGMLCLIHAFVIYASQCPFGHIKEKVLNGIILTELIAVTAYIIYDNLQTPPYDGWFLAILGYLFVYALIVITWLMYGIFTLLDEDKIYEMTIECHVRFMNKDYFKGKVSDGKYKYYALLPYSSELEPITEANKTQKVKFAEVLRHNLVVKLA